MNVVIAGAGIGGLTLALCLHQSGIDCEVFESAPEMRPLGVGINLIPDAVAILGGLGFAGQLAELAAETTEIVYCNKHGQRIVAQPVGRAAGREWPQYAINRGDLQMLLWRAAVDALGSVRVHLGRQLVSFEDGETRVTATFHDRRTGVVARVAEASLLVGADGIHSRIRREFYPQEARPGFNGRLLWRGSSESAPFLTGTSMVMAGHAEQRFIAYPTSRPASDGRVAVCWMAELSMGGAFEPGRDWNREVFKGRFASRFESWRFDWLDVPRVIRESGPVYEFPMIDRDPLPQWSFGRVTLLGDAAHPMFPVGGTGASQAILDAAALSRALSRAPDEFGALQRYEAERKGPTARLVIASREYGPGGILETVEERAPAGFASLDEVLSAEEIRTLGRGI